MSHLACERLRPRVVALILPAGAVVATRLLAHAPPEQPIVAATDLNQPNAIASETHVPMLAGSPRASHYAPGVSAILVSTTAQPGQAAISKADVRAYFDLASPPFWDSETPRPNLIAVECGHMRVKEARLHRSFSQPGDARLCLAVFRGDGETFAGVPVPPEVQVVRVHEGPVFAVQLPDADGRDLLPPNHVLHPHRARAG